LHNHHKEDLNQEQANPDVIASNINIAANSATLRPSNFVQNNSGASPSGSNKELLSGYSVPKNQQRRNMTRGEPRKPSTRHQELPKNMQKPLHPDNEGFLTVQLQHPIRQELNNHDSSKEDDNNLEDDAMMQHNNKHNNTVDTSGDQQASLNSHHHQDNYVWQHRASSSSQHFHQLFSHQPTMRPQACNNPDIGQIIQNFPNKGQNKENEEHHIKKELLRQHLDQVGSRNQAKEHEEGNLRQEIKKAFRQLEPVRQNLQHHDRNKTKSTFSNQTNRNMKNNCAVPKFDSSFTGDEVYDDGLNGVLSEESAGAGGVAELAEADQLQPAVHDDNNLYTTHWTTQAATHQNLSFHWPVNQQHDRILREAVNQRNSTDGTGEDGNNCVGVLREVTGSEDFMSTNQTPVLQLHPRYQVVGHDDEVDERGEMDDSSDDEDDDVTVSMITSRLQAPSGCNYAKERSEEEQVNSLVEEVLASSPDLTLANTETADDLPPYSG